GVVYSVTDRNAYDAQSRVNSFLHVNNTRDLARNGVLLCVNGAGILNSWLRKNCSANSLFDFDQMNALASTAPIGAKGVTILPFGNGAERILANREIQGSVHGLNFNTHSQSHLFRAAQEGIVFALRYGFDILAELGVNTKVIKAGKANMFLSPVFREAFVNTLAAPLELYDTDGAKGAALGAGVGAGIYAGFDEAFKGLKLISAQEIEHEKTAAYEAAYQHWKEILSSTLTESIKHK
ncbi:MAG TPA: FGGY-family carbohydrate kinase, partial [Cyclobacteriaceae bacterium]|nr:FGGY-family carbohydrate kinase [Cyclobacteriaceae bacterium]